MAATKSTAQRQKEYQSRQKALGLKEVRNLWARPEDHETVKRLARPAEGLSNIEDSAGLFEGSKKIRELLMKHVIESVGTSRAALIWGMVDLMVQLNPGNMSAHEWAREIGTVFKAFSDEYERKAQKENV